MASKKERQRNYELLRVIAMLMIVCLHYLGKGGLLGDPLREDMNATGYAVWLTEAFCLVSVNVYVLISGYFGAGKNASGDCQTEASVPEAASGKIPGVLRRPLRVWKQVIFYSLFFGLAALAAGVQQFDIYQCFSYVFPIVTEHYWFATAYVVLSLLMPFLDAGMCRLGKNAHAALIFALLLLFCISKTVIPMKLPWDQYGYDTYWFIVLYISGGYLRKYGIRWFTRRWQPAAVYAVSSLLVFLSFAVIRFIALRTGKLADLATYGYAYNYFFCYTGAVGLFCAFSHSFDKKKDAAAGRFLRTVSGATFGVYLIHEHINVRDKWGLLVDARTALDAPVPLFIIRMLVTVLAVYSVCTVIELTRQRAAALIGNSGKNAGNQFEMMGKKITGNIQWLLAAVLLLYPLRHAFTGVDLMDAGYALGNYRFFADMDETWKLATYLANVAGVLLSKLPFGNTWAGMNVYTGLLAGMTAAGTYLVLTKHYGHRLLLFAAEFVAVSLCWAPHVILYHYLGYILMTAAVLVLYRAIITASVKKYVMAGVILGLCVAVRMPNVTYMALILPVWFGCFLDLDKGNRDRTRKLPLLCMNTGFCIAGYAAGVILFLAVIGIRYGFDAYPAMVADLFGMTDTATDYKPASMVTAMLGDYIRYSKWLMLFLAYMAAGMVFFRICGHGREKLCKLLYIAGFLVLLRFCYGRGMFGFDYTTGYFSMYKLVTVFLLIVLVLCLYLVFYGKAAAQDRLWAVFLLVIIFITPLGSNNGLYPIINNLFIVAPVFVILLSHAGKGLVPERGAGLPLFAVRTVLYGILACTAVQSVLFGMFFVFHDDASPKARLALPAASPANGMKTGATAKEELELLAGYLKEQGLLDRKLILYGDIPALAYILDMEPAIYTTWADLDSKSAFRLKEDLDALTAASDEVLPVVIFKAEMYMKYCGGTVASDAQAVTVKAGMLREFLAENGYQPVYRGSGYIVLTGRR